MTSSVVMSTPDFVLDIRINNYISMSEDTISKVVKTMFLLLGSIGIAKCINNGVEY